MMPKFREPLKELERIRKEVPLFTEEKIKAMIKKSKKELSKLR
jgi:hypothetical protein